jgi:HPt (histidine-containing phosphotransfer) domain-containing protein
MAVPAGTLDPERIAMLRELDDGDGQLMGILAREYERDSNLQVATLQRALADADTETFVRSAHTLKGASANLGAGRLAELCARLEELGRTGALDGAASLVEASATELHDVHAALDQLLIEA